MGGETAAWQVPGPARPAAAQAMWFFGAPLDYLTRCRAQLGPCFTLQLPQDPLRIIVAEPDLIREILELPDEVFRYDTQSFSIDMGQQSILFQDAAQHRPKRRLLTPPMHGAALRTYAAQMRACAREHIDRWGPGPLTLFDEMRALTMSVFLRSVFGVTDPERADRLGGALLSWAEDNLSPTAMLGAMIRSPHGMRAALAQHTEQARARGALGWLRWTPWGGLIAQKIALLDLMQAEIDRYRADADKDARVDVLALLARSAYDDGSPMSDRDITDQLITLMVGGYETTSQTLCWLVHMLLQAPDALQQARAEARRDGVDPAQPGAAPWLEACLKEAMRLRPIAPVVNRHLKEAVTIGGHHVPADTILWPCSFLVQRDPALWEHPDDFRPQRWIDAPRAPLSRYFPWGAGERRCLGMAFSSMEMRIVLTEMLRRVEMTQPRPQDSRPHFRGISVGARDGVRLDIDAVRP